MRYVPIASVREGMIVGKHLYDSQGQLLLNLGSVIKQGYIDKMMAMGFQGLYIDDEISSEVEIKDIISDSLRIQALHTIKNVCIESIDERKYKKNNRFSETKLLIRNIVEDIISNRDTMVNLVDLKTYDDYTYFHSVNVAVLSVVIGTAYGLNKDQLIDLGLGAILHDIGKIFLDIKILNKKGDLTVEEYKHIKKHPELGYQYLKDKFEIPMSSYIGVLQHHEHYDGTGYPHQKKGKDISLYGRIICIADIYDALTSKRPYRDALTPSEAMEYIMANGSLIFDTELVEVFVKKVAPYPVGSMVQLSNGLKGIIVENYEDACLRPKVKIIEEEKDHYDYINLRDRKEYRNITILSICG